MKKVFAITVVLVLFAVAQAFAASSMSPTLRYMESSNKNIVVIKVICTAHTDGTFTTYALADTGVPPYYNQGYYLVDAWAVNDASTYPASGAITITDTSRQIIGSTAGDTMTLSTSASGVTYLSATRSAAQRAIVGQLSIAVSTTTTNGAIFTLYLVLGK